MSYCRSLRDELLSQPAQPLLRENEDNPFRDSAEATAFAMGNLLIKSGFMTQKEWVDIFSEEILKAQAQGDPDRGDTYYHHWMGALERIMVERGILDSPTLREQQDLWELAIKNTPHGVPLELENAYLAPVHDHDHDHHHPAHYHGDNDFDQNQLKPLGVSRLGFE